MSRARDDVTVANGKSFNYDSQNELITMNGGAVQMLYDGDGNRVAKTTASGTTRYLVDDLNPTGLPQVMDELTNGVVTRTYTYGLQRISEDQQINNVWTPSFYSYDGMGSVRQLTDINGISTDSYEYDAFGNQITHTGTTPNNYLYRGEEYDPDLGLYYLRARYMNPLTGRFMSRDPNDGNKWDPKSLHKYLYAEGNPVDAVDPSGRGAFFEFVLVTYFAAQRVLIATPPVVIGTCTILDYGSLALNAIQAGDIAGSGELPTGPEFWGWLADQAHQWCEEMFPFGYPAL